MSAGPSPYDSYTCPNGKQLKRYRRAFKKPRFKDEVRATEGAIRSFTFLPHWHVRFDGSCVGAMG